MRQLAAEVLGRLDADLSGNCSLAPLKTLKDHPVQVCAVGPAADPCLLAKLGNDAVCPGVPDPRSRPTHLNMVYPQQDDSWQDRRTVVRALGQTSGDGKAAAAAAVLATGFRDRSRAVQKSVDEALHSLGAAGASEVAKLLREGSRREQQSAAERLAMLGGTAFAHADDLTAALKSPHRPVRQAAATALQAVAPLALEDWRRASPRCAAAACSSYQRRNFASTAQKCRMSARERPQ